MFSSWYISNLRVSPVSLHIPTSHKHVEHRKVNIPTPSKSLQPFLNTQYINHPIPPLNPLPKLLMLYILSIEIIRYKLFVDTKDAAGFKYTCDFGVDCF